MNKHIQPLHKIVTVGFAFVAFSAAAGPCPSSLPASTVFPYSCDSKADEKTIYSNLNNTDITIDGRTHTATAPLTLREAEGTKNGIAVYRRPTSGLFRPYQPIGDIKITTLGHVNIDPSRNESDIDGILIVRAKTAEVILSKDTTITVNESNQTLGDGIVAGGVWYSFEDRVSIDSRASITTTNANSNGIIAKYANEMQIDIGEDGSIRTEGARSPAINSSPSGRANSRVKLNKAAITTLERESAGVVYKFATGLTTASAKNSLVELTDSSITTSGAQAHAIAAAGGGSATTTNHVNLTDSTLRLTGAGANGVHLNTRVNDQGKDTAQVTMQGGSITTAADGIHFIDSVNATTPVDQGTTGSVTLSDSAATGPAGWATIDAPSGSAIFTARGSDRVTLKNNTRIRGMVDGGDDAASLPDQWVDVLTFDDYDSTQQLAYTNALVQYQHFEDVKLQNNTVIKFPLGYSTPQSETYQIDSTSSIGKYIIGPTSTYTINATLTNDGTINLQDGTGGTVGDTLTVTGNAGGDGKFLFDIDATTGTADTLTINGDYTGNVKIGLNDVITTADPTQIIDLVIIKGTNKGGPVTLEPNTTPTSTTTPTTHTVGGVTYSLFSYEKSGAKIWALKVIPPTPAAKIPTLSAYGLLLLLLSMCLTVTRYFRNH